MANLQMVAISWKFKNWLQMVAIFFGRTFEQSDLRQEPL